MKATFKKYRLNFKQLAKTSREVMAYKETYFLKIWKDTSTFGIGECALFKGLSYDDTESYETKLKWLCKHINEPTEFLRETLKEYPSILFGLEQAIQSLNNLDPYLLYPSNFTNSNDTIKINGLIWMGDFDSMKSQIKEKIDQGFTTLKIKIGALDFESEIAFIKKIRNVFGASFELRLDANGAFSSETALSKIEKLSFNHIHSIEQPIKPGQPVEMEKICKNTTIPIALDEELIGVLDRIKKQQLIEIIKPQYIILKPSILGGYFHCEEWIEIANKQEIGWWVTSALESNVGLNAIAQWTYTLKNAMPQGLGTGGLFQNNIESPLSLNGENLSYTPLRETHHKKKLESIVTL